MKTKTAICFCSLFIGVASAIFPIETAANSVSTTSPDGKISVNVDDSNGKDILLTVAHSGKALIENSPLALNIRDGKPATKIKGAKEVKNRSESINAPNHHTPQFTTLSNDLNIKLDNGQELQLRVFNDGVAYRFATNSKNDIIIDSESAEFRLAGDPTLYIAHSTNPKEPTAMAFQNFYSVTPASSANPLLAFLPSTVDYGDGLKLTILESDLEAYPGMFLQADSLTNTLKGVMANYPKTTDFYPWRMQQYVTSREDYIAKTVGKRTFPWRVMAITTDDTQMPTNNLVYALASPSRVADSSWVKPGKSAWEWWNDWGLRNVPFNAGINNDTYKYFIDFAANNGIEYVVLDEGWYNPKSGDMLTTISEIDLPKLVSYANEKGVGLWLWTVFNVLDSQLEEACKKYSDLGIKGFKVDFLDRDDQTGVEMTYRIADATAKHNLMLDLHGFYKPTGLERTYPNVVNYESVFGMEEMKWSEPSVDMPEYDVTFPYIRMMAGPVDFTPGAMRNATRSDWKAMYSNPFSQGTRCHQIANYIVHDSPFSMLADSPTAYLENQECTDFITAIPSVFDETRVIDGKMGDYIVTLRRSGNNWILGGQTDWNPRDYTLDFSFLPSGKDFKVTLFKDGVNAAKQAQDYAVDQFTANSGSRRLIHMASGGGFAVRIDPL